MSLPLGNPSNMGTYYKFRSLQNFKRFLDILIDKRLYAATYKELNDPMEGVYMASSGLTRSERDKISKDKQQIRICSLSKNYNSSLMWTHYADEHRGCCIKIRVKNAKEVLYSDELETICEIKTAEEVLIHKSVMWQPEWEYRVLSKNSKFIPVEVEEVIFGIRVGDSDLARYRKIIYGIDDKIKVSRIERNELDNGYNNKQ